MVSAKFSLKRTLYALSLISAIIVFYIQDILYFYEIIVALRETTVDTRFMLQQRAWGLFQENMYLGVDYGSLSDLTLAGHWLHNAYLVLIFGAGTFGAIPFLVFILLCVVRGVQTYFAQVPVEQRIVAGGLVAGVSVSLVEWFAYGQIFNYASWLGLTLLYLIPLYRTDT
jgi:O-antigen ligase